MITLKIKGYKVTKICQEFGISPPLINVKSEHPQEHGKTIFGRAIGYGVVNMYSGSFEAAYQGALERSGDVVTPQALLDTCSAKATHVLLHELWHCKQLQDGRHDELSRDEAELEAEEFALSNEGHWPELVTLTDE